MIRKNQSMMEWIEKNKMTDQDSFLVQLYTAINQQSDICPYGNRKKITRLNSGFTGCGPASKCKCTKDKISKRVSETKSKFTDEKNHAINLKRKETMLERYGFEFDLQRPHVHEKISKPKVSDEVFQKLSDYECLHDQYVINKRTAVDIADKLKCYYGTVLEYCRSHGFEIKKNTNRSIIERHISEFINGFGIETSRSDWNILNGKELDIFIPSHNLAIEVNGLYWHSSSSIENDYRNRHLDKTLECCEKNITLLHFTDWEWLNKQDIVKSIIRSKLNQNDKIHARKTTIAEIDPRTEKNFFEENHLQGYAVR